MDPATTAGILGASCLLALCSVELATQCHEPMRAPAKQEPYLMPGMLIPLSHFWNGGDPKQGDKAMSNHTRLATKITFRRIRERVYRDAVEVFDACKGDRSMALNLQLGLLSRHPGHRETIRRAFHEIFDEPKQKGA